MCANLFGTPTSQLPRHKFSLPSSPPPHLCLLEDILLSPRKGNTIMQHSKFLARSYPVISKERCPNYSSRHRQCTFESRQHRPHLDHAYVAHHRVLHPRVASSWIRQLGHPKGFTSRARHSQASVPTNNMTSSLCRIWYRKPGARRCSKPRNHQTAEPGDQTQPETLMHSQDGAVHWSAAGPCGLDRDQLNGSCHHCQNKRPKTNKSLVAHLLC